MFTLYASPLSANGRKVMAACACLGLEPELREVNVYRGEGRSPVYLAVNPSGKIPALVDGSLMLTESNAILQYVSEAYGDCRLFSHDAKERAVISSWLFWESAHWQPALIKVLSAAVAHALFPERVPAPAAAPDWTNEELGRLLGRLEAHLAGRTFLVSAELSIADLSVAGMTTYFRAGGFPYDVYPNVAAWCDRLDSIDGWRSTAAPPWT